MQPHGQGPYSGGSLHLLVPHSCSLSQINTNIFKKDVGVGSENVWGWEMVDVKSHGFMVISSLEVGLSVVPLVAKGLS